MQQYNHLLKQNSTMDHENKHSAISELHIYSNSLFMKFLWVVPSSRSVRVKWETRTVDGNEARAGCSNMFWNWQKEEANSFSLSKSNQKQKRSSSLESCCCTVAKLWSWNMEKKKPRWKTPWKRQYVSRNRKVFPQQEIKVKCQEWRHLIW